RRSRPDSAPTASALDRPRTRLPRNPVPCRARCSYVMPLTFRTFGLVGLAQPLRLLVVGGLGGRDVPPDVRGRAADVLLNLGDAHARPRLLACLAQRLS